MSVFEYRKPVGTVQRRDPLANLRDTLRRLEETNDESPQVADLKRILAERIAKLEQKTA